MAKIRKFDLPPDLFEKQGVGMRELGKSIPDVTPKEYDKIVQEAEKAFKKPLERVTSKLLNELIVMANEIYESKTSLVTRKSLMVTVLINTVEDREVSVILRFDDLVATGEVRTELFKEMARQLHFGPNLKVKNGSLVGYLHMPTKVYVLPALVINNDGNRWERHVDNVDAERAALRTKLRSLT